MDAKQPGKSGPCPRPEEVLRMMTGQFKTTDHIMDFSSFSPSLYDTAWLSLVPTETDRQSRLFPQCLQLLLQAQQADGTWPAGAYLTDGILTSLAALSSITEHRSQSPPSSEEYTVFTKSIERGISGTQELLRSWTGDNATHVGFEIIAPALLRRLDQFGIKIEFSERPKLMELNQQKMSKCPPKIVYGPKQTTLLHSIEAFFDLVQFENISHHCSEELGVFGSPAATAAYLIYSPTWDHRAERYLQRAAESYGGTGAVPCAFPTPLFEISWAITTLLSPVMEPISSADQELALVTSFISETMGKQHELVGFAPGILEDADDTARCSLMLMRLKRAKPPGIAPMVGNFETTQGFKTYELERNASFSANCNVIMTLLESGKEATSRYGSQIEKTLTFLLELAEAEDPIIDKWNTSPLYSFMLLVEICVLALESYDAGCLDAISAEVITKRIPKTLCRIIGQVLAEQRSDGSWSGSLEVTSYSILLLSHSLRLPWSSSIREHLKECLAYGKSFVATEYPRTKQHDYLWIEKTTFESSLLRITYCSAAVHSAVPTTNWSSSIADIFSSSSSQSPKMKTLFTMLPLLENMQAPLIDLVQVEAKFHAGNLVSDRDSILPRGSLPLSKDQYLEYIPMIWLLCSQLNKHTLSPSVMKDMLKLSQLTFQVDEYMETTIAELPPAQVKFLESWIEIECSNMCSLKRNGTNGQATNGEGRRIDSDAVPTNGNQSPFPSVMKGLGKFIRYVLRHEATLRSSPLIQRFLAKDLSQYLLAHMRQNADNAVLKSINQGNGMATDVTDSSYFTWARNTGANHTSCPFAFRFFLCLISSKPYPAQQKNLDSAQAQYFASSVTQHLAAMCRQYNDYGSIQRDAEENNVNSVDFPEFRAHARGRNTPDDGAKSSGCVVSAKENLMAIAEFERQLMEVSFKALGKVIPDDAIAAVKVLVDVTDMFGQLYVAKDIASRKQLGKRKREEGD